jgi:hypothetical protein
VTPGFAVKLQSGESKEADVIEESPPEWRAFRTLLADLHDDMPFRVERLRYLWMLESDFGDGHLFLPGEHSGAAYGELRHAFVSGNFISVVLLGQCLLENVLAAHVSFDKDTSEIKGRSYESLREKPSYRDTLGACERLGVLSIMEVKELLRLADRRNALAHFRSVNDEMALWRRAASAGMATGLLSFEDARFAMGLVVRVLAKPEFVVGGPKGDPRF